MDVIIFFALKVSSYKLASAPLRCLHICIHPSCINLLNLFLSQANTLSIARNSLL